MHTPKGSHRDAQQRAIDLEALTQLAHDASSQETVDHKLLGLTSSDVAGCFAVSSPENLADADRLLELADHQFRGRLPDELDEKTMLGYQAGFVHATRNLIAILRDRPRRTRELAQTSQRAAIEHAAVDLLSRQGQFSRVELIEELEQSHVVANDSNVSHALRTLAEDGVLERVPNDELAEVDRRTAHYRNKARGGADEADPTPSDLHDG